MEVIIKGSTKEIVDFLDSLQAKNAKIDFVLNAGGNDIIDKPIKLNKPVCKYILIRKHHRNGAVQQDCSCGRISVEALRL